MKRSLSALLAVVLVFTLCSCSSEQKASSQAQSSESQQQSESSTESGAQLSEGLMAGPEYPSAIGYGDFDAQNAWRSENAVDEAFVEAVKEFSFSTASKILAGADGNKNYSPVSLYMALAMAAYGAGGDTQTQMLKLLGAQNMGGEWLYDQTGRMFRLLYTDNEYGKLRLANSVWADESFDVSEKFAAGAAGRFYASVYKLAFSEPSTGKIMGNWVGANTGGTIVPEIKPDQNAVLAIMNTIWLRDEWIDPFDKSQDTDGVFHAASGQDSNCVYMNRTFTATASKKGKNYLSAGLALKNFGQMTFILPDEGVSPDDILSDPQALRDALDTDADRYGQVVWQIPKFSFDCGMQLADTLKALGVTDAFDSAKADFSAIGEGLTVSSVDQDTHIAVNEDGVEASSFTSIMMEGAGIGQDETSRMILDRPFIYAITSGGGALLFVGVVNDAAES